MARRSATKKSNPIQQLNLPSRTLFEGDNLLYLQAINTNSVDLIITDPPYNKSKDFYVTLDGYTQLSYPDRWTWKDDIHDLWMENIQEHEPKIHSIINSALASNGKAMGAFLAFMAMRLIEMRRILKPNGSIYLQCDDFANRWLGVLMDGIFGEDKFKNEIIWKRTNCKNNAKQKYGRLADRILFYSGRKINRNDIRIPLSDNDIKQIFTEKDNRDFFQTICLTTRDRKSSGERRQTWCDYTPPQHRVWRPPLTGDLADYINDYIIPGYKQLKSIQKRLDALKEANLIVFSRNGVPRVKQYLQSNKGKVPNDIWDDIGPVSNPSPEYVDFDTQKPLALVERQILASSDPGDIVMDPFAGSCTTLIAAEKLGRQWVGMDVGHVSGDLLNLRIARNHDIEATPEDINVTQKVPVRNYTVSEKANLNVADTYFECPTKTLNQERKIPEHKLQEIIKREKFADILKRIKHLSEVPKGHGICPCCGHVLHFKHFDLDHIFPVSRGGITTRENTQILCHNCNAIKNNRLISLEDLQKVVKEKDYQNEEMFRKYHGLPPIKSMEPLTTKRGGVLARNWQKVIRFLNMKIPTWP